MVTANTHPLEPAAESLPAFLRVADIRDYLQLSHGAAYELVKREGLAMDLGARVVRVPRDRFLAWLASRGAPNAA